MWRCRFEDKLANNTYARVLAEYSAGMQWQGLGLSVMHPRERTLAEAAGRLHTLKVLLPEDPLPDGKYVAELHSILDFMEKGSGLDLSRYRMSARVPRTFLRINILALLGVCAYQSRPVALPLSHPRAMSRASTRVH
jgi:hypothetical protein